MTEKRVKVSSIIQNQLPEFVQAEFPLVLEFLKQYYYSLESKGNPYDLMNNIDQYVKVDNLGDLIRSTTLIEAVNFVDSDIYVESTAGFPDTLGLIQINDEIIAYESKDETSFKNCYRGFSGVTSYNANSLADELIFSSSDLNEHSVGDVVNNLNSLLLSEFFNKIKKQITPGFENRPFYEPLNEKLFVKQANNFYTSKGTSESFRILFNALYGKPAEVILPRDYLIEPSVAQYRITKNLVVEQIQGNPENLLNKTLYQNKTSSSVEAQGTVVNVEKITRSNVTRIGQIISETSSKSAAAIVKDYYIVSLDFDYDKDIESRGSTQGKFTIHPKSKLVSDVTAGQEHLDVDSTLGFPNFGSLIVNQPEGNTILITYTSKSTTQFFDCSGITQNILAGEEVKYNDYAYATDIDGSEIRVRITGVISELDSTNTNNLLESGFEVNLKSLGKYNFNNDVRVQNWFLNVASNYKIQNIEPVNDISDFSYRVTTFDENDFKIGDPIYLVGPNGKTSDGIISDVQDNNTVSIRGQGELNINLSYTINRSISKLNLEGYPELNIYNSNVSGVYYDNKEDSVYITASSLPRYGDDKIRINTLTKQISSISNETISFTNAHLFLTGDLLIVKLNNRDQIVGYCKKIGENKIKVAKTSESIIANNFVDFSSYAGGSVGLLLFNTLNESTQQFEEKDLQTQKLIRGIKKPESYGSSDIATETGPIGIFVNGVEIQNYKSGDYIYYGEIESIDVLSEGSGYDVINTPILNISDSVGSGATGNCSVSGSLERIDIIDPGFNYSDIPEVIISGGNGSGAKAEAFLKSYDYEVDIIPSPFSVSSNQITFDSPHKFSNYEEVIYITNGTNNITGLTTNSSYYVGVVGINTITLHSSYQKAVAGIGISFSTTENLGLQKFKSAKKKNRLGGINVISKGSGYTNRKMYAYASKSGINTSFDSINIKDHGFSTGELISYKPQSTSIGGLTTSNYYVESIDSDSFRLYEVSNNDDDFLLRTGQYINLTSVGGEVHEFNYPDITVSINGIVEIPSLYNTSTEFEAEVIPVFRGNVKSIFIEDGGSNYGDREIINYSKQPQITLESGSGAEVEVVIYGGEIIFAYPVKVGSNYNIQPDLIINGDGIGAKLSPVIENGKLTRVVVVSSGSGYTKEKTRVDVLTPGTGAKFSANIKPWNINLPYRLPSILYPINNDENDDGCLVSGRGIIGLQYGHIYASRGLRKSVLGIRKDGLKTADLVFDDNGKEVSPGAHSPIIGWSYDGHPIYGPYGYTNTDGSGGIKRMRSGYSEILSDSRPSGYVNGFFVEDYQFTNSGDLDRRNGRFCVTPEFPDGTYAYFATFSSNYDSTDKYLLPEFPYLIGNYYKSKSNEFNFKSDSNQDSTDINKTGWIKNTYTYNVSKKNSSYDYFLNSSYLKPKSTIKTVSAGKIDSIEIINGGNNYRVGDRIVFDNAGTGGRSASAFVSNLKGVGINSVSCASTSIQNIEFEYRDGNYVGYAENPHELETYFPVKIFALDEVEQKSRISFTKNQFTLVSGIGTVESTGIATYISVSGNLQSSAIRENDFYQIGSEKVKVLSIDSKSSRIRILRNQDGASELSTHSAGIGITELPRKISVNFNPKNNYNKSTNRELYFDPSESVGIGTSFGIGITSTLYFSNPGVGNTTLTIPTKAIYLPNHNLSTGDLLVYNTNGGNSIEVSKNGADLFSLGDGSQIFAAKLSKDLIGISTFRVGLNSEGNFVGVGTTPANLLYFTGIGTNTYHSFKTLYDDVLIAEASRNVVTVSTAQTHGISIQNQVDITVRPKTSRTVVVKYNNANRRVVLDPLSFTSLNVDIENNSIYINNHNIKYGEKIIFEETITISGLIDNQIYYVNPINSNEIKLYTSIYNLEIDSEVNITSTGSGTISKINPEIEYTEYETISFDLSDESLSYVSGNTSFPAFDLNLYLDENYSDRIYAGNNERFIFSKKGSDGTFNTYKVGVNSAARLELTLNDNSPKKIYYKLVPVSDTNNPNVKREIIVDVDQPRNNQINVLKSRYSGTKILSGISSNTFTYQIDNFPESSSYAKTQATLSYNTNSEDVLGEISKIKVSTGGYGYKSLPKVSIQSNSGINANIYSKSSSVGIISTYRLSSIGYDYSADSTIRPSVNIPNTLTVDPLFKIESVEVLKRGFAYTEDTNLIVIDGITGELISDAILVYKYQDNVVDIIQNTEGISDVQPIIIPVNNSNGIEIDSIVYDTGSKNVTVTLAPSFSDASDFPFKVGTKVLIENVSLSLSPDELKNYNSSDYNYTLFTINNVDPNIGGIGATVSYSMSELISPTDTLGTFNRVTSNARIIPEKYFPTFNVKFEDKIFIRGEDIVSDGISGTVESWNSQTKNLVVSSRDKFVSGKQLVGKTSNTKANIISVDSSEGFYVIDSGSTVDNRWNNEKGFLNNDSQRIHDSDYYQYFSYALKSEIPLNVWEDSVSILNHTAGFKKFSLVGVTSDSRVGISTDQNSGNVTIVSNIDSIIDLDCITNFDLATENLIFDGTRSNNIIFNSRLIQDYIQSVGNIVIDIDDISDQFDSNTEKDFFELTHRGLKIFERDFDGSDSSIVDINDDIIIIPDHFFTTGEEIIYNGGGNLGSPIGIGTTTIPGIGSTDKLPSTLYIVKIDNSRVRVSASATEALKVIPTYLDLTSVGVGTTHKFESQKQNTKCLISIDNVIQSPIVSTAKTTQLSSDFVGLSTVILVDDPLQISGGEFLKVEDEIVRVVAVGYGSTNSILVDRAKLGTISTSHLTGSLVTKIEANYNITNNIIYFASPPKGQVPTENPLDPEETDFDGLKIRSTFSGRAFMRSGVEGTNIQPYESNYIFDSISDQFNGITNTITLKSDYQNVSGFSTDNAITLVRNVMQLPARLSTISIEGDYDLEESSGITSITFTGSSVGASYDINNSSVPRGGIIVSVGSTQGFGYQPLVSAGGTAVVSIAGTISSISIGNSGSGYRSGIQTVVNVGVVTTSLGIPNIEFIGTAAISNGNIVSVAITNPGSGYTSTNPPDVIFDEPLSYSNIPLIYSSDTPQPGIGTEATVDLIVSQDSSVLNYEIKNYGYAYNKYDILTVAIGGTTGIPTNTSLSYDEFQLTIDSVYDDQFSAWHLGKIQVLDPIDDLIDGVRTVFPLRIDGRQTSIEKKPRSNIILQNTLLIFINDVLQVPGESYVFDGGSTIRFLQAPQSLDIPNSNIARVAKSKILFYAGTDDVDTKFVDIFETVKVGDTLRLDSDDINLKENRRIVNEIITSDTVKTNTYSGRGLSNSESLERNVIWCKQRNDIFLSAVGFGQSTNNFVISKARESYEPVINPTSYLIKDVSTTDTEIFVDNLKTIFDNYDEIGDVIDGGTKTIKILSQDSLISCAATATVSIAGTISSIEILDNGLGYSTTPNVYISSPISSGSTAIATATISGGNVVSIDVSDGGSGYTNPPSVLIDPPDSKFEQIEDIVYEGDFGIITGITTVSVGVASTGIQFELFIPEYSYIRDGDIAGTASTTISGIQTGYYFVVRNSNVGYGLTSLDDTGSIVGVGSTFIDNVYQVASVSIAQTTVSGVGTTSVARVVVSVEDYNGLVSLGQTYFYGEYSWGRISGLIRKNPTEFSVYNNGIVGITTSPIVQRYQPLKNYLYRA